MKNENLNFGLYSDLKNIIEQSRKYVITKVNTIMLQTYWDIGKRIVEEEQKGNLKAEYGSGLLKEISKRLGKAESEIYGVATFYAQFSLEKTATYTISVCTGTTCFILGAEKILEEICNQLNVKPDTISEDGKWYVSTARCIGCCGMAPVMSINGEVYGNLKPNMIKDILAKYE